MEISFYIILSLFISMILNTKGILIVSEFSGISRALTGALRVNPFSPPSISQQLDLAMSMHSSERTQPSEKNQDSKNPKKIKTQAAPIHCDYKNYRCRFDLSFWNRFKQAQRFDSAHEGRWTAWDWSKNLPKKPTKKTYQKKIYQKIYQKKSTS